MTRRTILLHAPGDELGDMRTAYVEAIAARGFPVTLEPLDEDCIVATHDLGSWTVRWSSRELPLTLGAALTPEDLASVLVLVGEVDLLQRHMDAMRDAESTALVASVVAHDTNNMLMPMIHAAAELSRLDLPAVVPHAECITEGCSHITALMRRVILMTRSEGPQLIHVNPLLATLVPMLRTIAGTDIHFATRFEDPLPQILMDPLDLKRAVINLVVNARDAMPDGGRLTLSTADVRVGQDDASDAPRGRWVIVLVEDSGVGMDDGTRAQAFDPFFTTKPAGKGTGLGLTSVMRAARAAGGHVRVHTEVGKGTRVELWLPSLSTSSEAVAPRP